MKIKQKTIVERMKPLYPALTQPIVSAVSRGKAGVQYTNSFRRNAEERGIAFRHDRDGRINPCPHKVRLTDAEDTAFRKYLEATGQTAQELLHKAVIHVIQGGRI
jgi:hypothetical protein